MFYTIKKNLKSSFDYNTYYKSEEVRSMNYYELFKFISEYEYKAKIN